MAQRYIVVVTDGRDTRFITAGLRLTRWYSKAGRHTESRARQLLLAVSAPRCILGALAWEVK